MPPASDCYRTTGGLVRFISVREGSLEPLEPTKYRDALRSVGDLLDSRGDAAFTVLEVPGGFEIVVDSNGGPARTLIRVNRDEEMKPRGRDRRAAVDAFWKSMGTTGGEFLEAVGIELERRGAHNILIDRLADGLVLSYSFLDPLHGYAWGKSVVICPIAELRRILDAGREEMRRTKKRWIF